MGNFNFRAWDSLSKSFKYISEPNDFKFWCSSHGGPTDSEFPDMDINSGIKDVNGNFIFSGDKINFFYFDDDDFEVYTVVFGCYGYSKTVGFHCLDKNGEPYSFYGGMPDSDCMLISGNRHDN